MVSQVSMLMFSFCSTDRTEAILKLSVCENEP